MQFRSFLLAFAGVTAVGCATWQQKILWPRAAFSSALHVRSLEVLSLIPITPLLWISSRWASFICDALILIHIKSILYIYICTSSTAQGGGGSFKNRKPIGEIGCCESGMAERSHWWTERCLRSPLFLSLSLTIYLPTNQSSMYLSIYRSISLSLSFI